MSNVTFNEAFMGAGEPLKGSLIPGFGAANRTPDTSRVERKKTRSSRVQKPVFKGLARSAVSVKRLDPRTYEVRVKGTEQIVGHVRKVKNAGGVAYSFQMPGQKAKVGYATQKAAVQRMLERS